MTKPPHIVELNGKRYDAQSGKLLGSSRSAQPAAKKAHQVKHVDQTLRRRPERAQTLMRHTVKKPEVAKTSAKELPKVLVPHASVDPKRLVHAKHVHKSARISKFGAIRPAVAATPAVLPVQPEPESPPPFVSVRHEASFSPRTPKYDHRPDFHKALHHATSHTEPRHKKTSRRARAAQKIRVSPRIVNIAAGSLAVLILAGFFAWQNVPNISMRLAAAQAGVNGALPGYRPAGFGLSGPIQYGPGEVTVTYKSRTDDRAFQVHQRDSRWTTNPALEKGYLAANNLSYQTLSNEGKTIYIYDGSNATWVENDTWYQIEGNSSLSPDQLLRLAASM